VDNVLLSQYFVTCVCVCIDEVSLSTSTDRYRQSHWLCRRSSWLQSRWPCRSSTWRMCCVVVCLQSFYPVCLTDSHV